MSETSVPVTIISRVSIDIARPPASVWDAILEDYVAGRKFAEAGYVIERLDGPAYFRGGYRMRLVADGSVVDERKCCVTELDVAARRLSLYADYVTAPGGMKVHATYQAREHGTGATFLLDSYSRFGLDLPTEEGETNIRAAVAKLEARFDAALAAYLKDVKARLEAD